MRTRQAIAGAGLVMVAALLQACAGQPRPETPRQPPPLDPVGTYQFTTTVNGDPVKGTINIQRNAQGYGGVITTDMTGDHPITAVTVAANVVSITADTPDGPVTLHMTVEGDAVRGDWVLGDMGGSFTGKKTS